MAGEKISVSQAKTIKDWVVAYIDDDSYNYDDMIDFTKIF